MLSNEPRIRGFQRPFSMEQLIAGIGEIIFTVLAYIIFSLYARDGYKILTICVYSIPVLMVFVTYIYCSYIDPSIPGGIPCVCMRTTQNTNRYCRLCRKTIPGLDHHCTWLNTCIGSHNYWAFYILATGGILQYILHIVFCVLTVTLWYEESNRSVGSIIFISIVAVMGLSGVLSFGSLWLFHTHLLFEGIGTYDWLLRRAERTRIRQEQDAKALREKTLKETNQSLMVPSGGTTTTNTPTTGSSVAALTTDLPYPSTFTTANIENDPYPVPNDTLNGASPVTSPSVLRAIRVAEMQQNLPQPSSSLSSSASESPDIQVDIPPPTTPLSPTNEGVTVVSSPDLTKEEETTNEDRNHDTNPESTDEATVDDIIYIKQHINESTEPSHRDLRRHLFTAKTSSTKDEVDNDSGEEKNDTEERNTNDSAVSQPIVSTVVTETFVTPTEVITDNPESSDPVTSAIITEAPTVLAKVTREIAESTKDENESTND